MRGERAAGKNRSQIKERRQLEWEGARPQAPATGQKQLREAPSTDREKQATCPRSAGAPEDVFPEARQAGKHAVHPHKKP